MRAPAARADAKGEAGSAAARPRARFFLRNPVTFLTKNYVEARNQCPNHPFDHSCCLTFLAYRHFGVRKSHALILHCEQIPMLGALEGCSKNLFLPNHAVWKKSVAQLCTCTRALATHQTSAHKLVETHFSYPMEMQCSIVQCSIVILGRRRRYVRCRK